MRRGGERREGGREGRGGREEKGGEGKGSMIPHLFSNTLTTGHAVCSSSPHLCYTNDAG